MRDRGAEEGRGVRAREAERREKVGWLQLKSALSEAEKERKSVCDFSYCSIITVRPIAIFLLSKLIVILHNPLNVCVMF